MSDEQKATIMAVLLIGALGITLGRKIKEIRNKRSKPKMDEIVAEANRIASEEYLPSEGDGFVDYKAIATPDASVVKVQESDKDGEEQERNEENTVKQEEMIPYSMDLSKEGLIPVDLLPYEKELDNKYIKIVYDGVSTFRRVKFGNTVIPMDPVVFIDETGEEIKLGEILMHVPDEILERYEDDKFVISVGGENMYAIEQGELESGY